MLFTEGPGARIHYEVLGNPSDVPVLLVQGYTAQMVGWRDGFCRKLTERGLCVIRFDNRDVGRSERFGGPGDADGGYTLADMARDGFGVLDALNLRAAHVVGQSMGGMIAQLMAEISPERVGSLSLIYTLPQFDKRYLVDDLDAVATRAIAPRLPRHEAIEQFVLRERLCQSTEYPFNEAWIRELGALCYDRGYGPDGDSRQWHAITRSRERFANWERLKMPVSIIHGRADALIKVEGSLALAAMIAQAELHIYPGMGHELVEPLWDEYANIIERTVRREGKICAG